MRLDHAARSAQPVEQRQLGVAVGLPRAVQLEMLVGHVGEDGHVVGDARHPLEREPMRRRLHDRDAIAGIGHRAQRGLQLRCFGGGGVDCVVLGPPADARRDRADHAGREPGGLEGRNGEIGRRRLAVGAGDADHRQLVRRIAVPPRGGTGQRGSRGGDHELRRGDPGHRPLDDHARRARLDRRRHEVVAVGVLPRNGDVEHPRPNLARVVSHARHVDAAQIGRGNRPAVATRAAQPVLRREALHQPLEPTPLGLSGHR